VAGSAAVIGASCWPIEEMAADSPAEAREASVNAPTVNNVTSRQAATSRRSPVAPLPRLARRRRSSITGSGRSARGIATGTSNGVSTGTLTGTRTGTWHGNLDRAANRPPQVPHRDHDRQRDRRNEDAATQPEPEVDHRDGEQHIPGGSEEVAATPERRNQPDRQ